MASDNEVNVKITATTSGLQSGMQQASSAVSASTSELQGLFSGLQQGVASSMQKMQSSVLDSAKEITGSLLALGAAMASVEGLKAAVEKNLEYTDSLLEMSRMMGMTTEQAGIMTTALKLIGSNSQSYIDSNLHLNRALKSNEDGLNKMGIVTRSASGSLLEQGTIFQNALNAMMDYKEGTDRNEFAMSVFGRGVKEAMQFVKLNSSVMDEATRLAKSYGLAVGDEAAHQTEEFGIQLRAANLIFDGMKVTVGQQLLPTLVELAGWFAQVGPTAIQVIAVSTKVLIQVFEAVVLIIRDVYNVAASNFKELASLIAGVAVTVKTVLVGAFQTALDLVTGILGTLSAAVKRLLTGDLTGAWEELKNGTANTMTQMGSNIESTVKQTATVVKSTHKEMAKTAEDFAKDVVAYHADAQKRVDQMWAGTAPHLAEAMKQGTKEFGAAAAAMGVHQDVLGKQIVEYTKIQLAQTAAMEKDAAAQQVQHGKDITAALISEYKIRSAAEAEMYALAKAESDQLEQDEADAAQRARLERVAAIQQAAHDEAATQQRLGQDVVAASVKQYKDQEAAAAAAAASKMMAGLTQPVSTAFNQMTTGILRGNQTWQQATQHLVTNLEASYVNMMADTLIKWITNQLTMTAVQAAESAKRMTLGEGEAAAGILASAGGMIQQILNDSFKVFADIFSFLAPAGPEVAVPGATGAAAMVAGMAGSIVSAAGGFDVPRDTITQLHKNEMVLPAGLSDRIRGMTDSGGGGDSHTHIHIHAVDAKSFESRLADSSGTLRRMIQTAVRNGTA